MHSLGSPGLQGGIVSTGHTSLITTTKKTHHDNVNASPAPTTCLAPISSSKQRSSKRSGFSSPCSTTALQVSARLAAIARHSQGICLCTLGSQSYFSHQQPSIIRYISATPPMLSACSHDATNRWMLHKA